RGLVSEARIIPWKKITKRKEEPTLFYMSATMPKNFSAKAEYRDCSTNIANSCPCRSNSELKKKRFMREKEKIKNQKKLKLIILSTTSIPHGKNNPLN